MKTTIKIVGFTILILTFVLLRYLSGSEESVIFAENEILKTPELNWIDDDDNHTLSVSTETNVPISGNGSLRVDIKPTTTINATNNASWNIVRTDFIPAVENVLYNYSLDVSAEHVNQLHAKVYYYNLSRMSISENFIFGGKDGTFEERFNNSFLSPMGTQLLQFQMWVKPTTGRNASYLIDNINLGQNDTYSLNTLQNITERPPMDLSTVQYSVGNLNEDNLPVILNNNSYFSIERMYTGLNFPTSMAFLGPDDILVLEKNQGIVKRIVNGTILGDPLLDVNVGTKAERGMLGIDISRQKNDRTAEATVYVFLYYTETKQRDGEDDNSSRLADIPGKGPVGNRLYRYELVVNKLVNPKLLIDLPAEPKPNHQGGVVHIGPDNNVYVIIGDVDHFMQAQNYQDGNESDGTGGILMISQQGKVIEDGILGDSYPLNLYYAYGIRNSFGFDFDPVTGNLWDTENGLRCCDEINMVEKGFNSGWDKVQGFWNTNHSQKRDRDGRFDADSTERLVTFDDKGEYSSPEFVWNNTVAPTAIKFFNSSKFSIILAGIALVSIFLTMGTKSPINYFDIALLIPVVSNFIWVFRDPEKWAFFTTFAYSFLIGMVCYKLLGYTRWEKYGQNKRIVIGTIIIFLISSIFISSYPYYNARMEPLIPIQFPVEFDKLNNYLNTINTEKVYFIPYPIKETDWDKNGVVQNIYNTHSIKPSIDSSEYYPLASTYYNYLVNSVMENRSKGISNLINPLGTSYVIFHNDSWNKLRDRYDADSIQLLDKLYQVDGLNSTASIGFYNIFNTTNNDNSKLPRQVNIPYQSIGVIGGLDVFSSLESVPTFSSIHSSLLFLDDIKTTNTSAFANGFDDLLIDRSPHDDELALSFLDKRYILTPFDYTTSNDPAKVWSKAGARDPIHGAFHPDLKGLGINNWDFDYGHGLVKTKAIANMSIPIDTRKFGEDHSENEDFYLFMRYFKNQKGGPINIYLDNKLISQVDAFDKLSNNFVWQNIGNVKLQNQKHMLKLENVGGFNAVNIFALIPESVMNNLRLEYEKILEDKSQVIYLLEAEKNFNNIRGEDKGSPAYVVYQNQTTDSDIFDRNITGKFKVPNGSDLVSLKFHANKSQPNSHFFVKDVQLFPAQEKYSTFVSDFERTEHSIPLASLRYSDWLNLDKNLSSTTIISSGSANGGKSLRVDMIPSDQVGWDIITTNFVPVSDKAYYNASLHLSAKDVVQLHSKIFYFDSQEKEFIGSPHYILDGKDGTFDETFSSIVVPPEGTRYIKIQVLAKSANPVQSSYTLDNVRFEEILFPKILKNSMGVNFDSNVSQEISSVGKGSLLENNSLGNGTDYISETIPYEVKQDHIYDYNLNVAGNNISSYSVIATFRSSNDVSENATRYGNNASNGRVLELASNSEIHTRLNILKSDNYSIGLKAKTCETCSFLKLDIEPTKSDNTIIQNLQTGNFSLRANKTALSWVYTSNTFNLTEGTYDVKIFSDSTTDLDIIAAYPVKNKTAIETVNGQVQNNDLKDAFAPADDNLSSARIVEYEKINPTKYIVKISNATRPYVISFAESYDPLWQAYVDTGTTNNANSMENSHKTNSIALYGLTNGFYINKLGNYTLVLEYSPQVWFNQGLIISILSLVVMSIVFLLIKGSRKRILKFAKSTFRKNKDSEG